ncbi:MAG TPA: hypothetical protein EYP02_05390, partial [Sulfurovum sp.]|nr:hypothetical protein [Sulfurovum sp.]
MNSIFKKILLLVIIIFTNFIFAGDGEDIHISISDAPTVHEDSGTMSFTISLNDTPDYCTDVTVNYTTADGSAEAGSDYTNKSGSVTFYGTCLNPFNFHPIGEDTKVVTVDITNTVGNYEPDEYLYMNISNSTTGYKVTDNKAEGYIIDNNPAPLKLTLHSRSEVEQDGNWVLNFTARLNQPAPADGVTVHYTTQDSSAIAGDDYIATTGSITIPQGEINGYIPVTIIGDTLPEPTNTEHFKIKITNISKGSVTNTNNEAKGTITDDDRVKVDISSSDVNEGDSGDNNKMEFKIFLAKDYPNIAPLTINYTTADGSDPSATIADLDYTSTSGSVTFNFGDREKIILVPITGDDKIESDENLKMIISGSSLIIDDSSESEIINDDGSYPGVDFDTGDFSIIEGNSSVTTLNFHFTLDDDALPGSSFDYYTQDDEATVADSD